MLNRRHKVLFSSSEATVGNWYALDYKGDDGTRSLLGRLTSGDTVIVEATPQQTYNTQGTPVSVSVVVTIGTFTSTTFNALLDGPMAGIRIRKSGTTGLAQVEGVI